MGSKGKVQVHQTQSTLHEFAYHFDYQYITKHCQALGILPHNDWDFDNYYSQSDNEWWDSELQERSGDTFWKIFPNTRRREPSQQHKTSHQGCYLYGYQRKQAGRIQLYDPKIHEKGGEAKLGCTLNAWHRDCANECTQPGATQWSRLSWLKYSSHRRSRDHRIGWWGNWSPKYWADRTRDWYRSYIVWRRITTRTSGTSRHTQFWTRKRYGYRKRGCKPRVTIENNWSSCAMISGRRITGDHIDGQDFYPWGNTRSVHIL